MSKPDALSDISLEMISSIMGWSILRWSSACRHDMESVKIKNLFLLECSMHSRASSMARASAVKMEQTTYPSGHCAKNPTVLSGGNT